MTLQIFEHEVLRSLEEGNFLEDCLHILVDFLNQKEYKNYLGKITGIKVIMLTLFISNFLVYIFKKNPLVIFYILSYHLYFTYIYISVFTCRT